jgi:hypothetical protein
MKSSVAFPLRDIVAVLRHSDGSEERVPVIAFVWNEGLRLAEPLVLGDFFLCPAEELARLGGEYIGLEQIVDASSGGSARATAAIDHRRTPDEHHEQ